MKSHIPLLPAMLLVYGAFLSLGVYADEMVSGFRSPEDVAAAGNLLRQGGMAFVTGESADREPLGFIVVSKTMSGADASLLEASMKQAGLDDVAYVAIGTYAERISAGVFSTREAADSRLVDLAREGYKFEVRSRSRIRSYEGWIEVKGVNALPNTLIGNIEKRIGYQLQTEMSTETGAVDSIQAAPQEIVVETPVNAPVETAVETPVNKTSNVPASSPPVQESRPAPIARTSVQTPKTGNDFPLLQVFFLAVVVSGIVAVLFVRWSRRPVAENSRGELLGYDTVEIEGESEEEPITAVSEEREIDEIPVVTEQVSKSPIADLAERLLADSGSHENSLMSFIPDANADSVELIADLLHLAAVDSVEHLTFDLQHLLDDLVQKARENGIDIKRFHHASPFPFVRSDADGLSRIVRNMFVAISEVDDAIPLDVSGEIFDELLAFSITDSFTELEPEACEALFDTETLTGMRLATSRKLARAGKGDLVVFGEPGVGTTMRLNFPVEVIGDEVMLADGRRASEVIESEAKARAAVDSLSGELTNAEEITRRELEQRETAIASANERVETLRRDLDALRTQADAEMANHAAFQQEREQLVEHLKVQLATERDRLSSELENRAASESAAIERARALADELESVRAQATAEAAQIEEEEQEARHQIEQLRTELEETQIHAGTIRHKNSEAFEQLRKQNESLSKALSVAEAKLESDREARRSIEDTAQARLEELRIALEAANEAVDHHAESKRLEEERGNAKIALLTEELDETRAEITDLRARLDQYENADVDGIKSSLANVEAELEREVVQRERVEKETTSYIDELLDDLNKAKSDVRRAEKLRANAELAAGEELEKLSAELADTRARLIAEAAARQRAEAKAKKIELEPATAAVQSSGPLIKSSMPMDNPILRSMAERFVVRLDEQLDGLEAAFDNENVHEMALITSWLKGETYTLGFHEFSGPVGELETLLKEKAYTRVPAKLVELKQMAGRIQLLRAGLPQANLAPSGVPTSRLKYVLPENPRKAALMRNFIGQLGTELLEMESALSRNETTAMVRSIRWTLKYAGAFDLSAIIDAAQALDEAVACNSEDIQAKLAALSALYSKIEVVSTS